MPGFHIEQEIMEYLTKCSQLWLLSTTSTTPTSDTLVANISEILVELKEIRMLDVCSFWRKIRESRLLHHWVCLCKHAYIKHAILYLTKNDLDMIKGQYFKRKYNNKKKP